MDKIPFTVRKARGLLHAVSLLESFDTTGSVNQLLLSGEKGMAGRAYFSAYFRLRGACLKRIAAQAPYRHFRVLGMNSFFHYFLLARCYSGS